MKAKKGKPKGHQVILHAMTLYWYAMLFVALTPLYQAHKQNMLEEWSQKVEDQFFGFFRWRGDSSWQLFRLTFLLKNSKKEHKLRNIEEEHLVVGSLTFTKSHQSNPSSPYNLFRVCRWLSKFEDTQKKTILVCYLHTKIGLKKERERARERERVQILTH
jgi:hypothetical protein